MLPLLDDPLPSHPDVTDRRPLGGKDEVGDPGRGIASADRGIVEIYREEVRGGSGLDPARVFEAERAGPARCREVEEAIRERARRALSLGGEHRPLQTGEA